MRQATTGLLALLLSSATFAIIPNFAGAATKLTVKPNSINLYISSSATKVDGLNVQEVRHEKGFFKAQGNGKWLESSNDGTSTFNFRETRRAKHSVYLEDQSRKVYIQLNLSKGSIVYSDVNYEYDLYKITSMK